MWWLLQTSGISCSVGRIPSSGKEVQLQTKRSPFPMHRLIEAALVCCVKHGGGGTKSWFVDIVSNTTSRIEKSNSCIIRDRDLITHRHTHTHSISDQKYLTVSGPGFKTSFYLLLNTLDAHKVIKYTRLEVRKVSSSNLPLLDPWASNCIYKCVTLTRGLWRQQVV